MTIANEIRLDGAIKKLHYNIREWEKKKTRNEEELKHAYLLFATLCLRERWIYGLLHPIDIKKDDTLALKLLKGTGLNRQEKIEGYYSFS